MHFGFVAFILIFMGLETRLRKKLSLNSSCSYGPNYVIKLKVTDLIFIDFAGLNAGKLDFMSSCLLSILTAHYVYCRNPTVSSSTVTTLCVYYHNPMFLLS